MNSITITGNITKDAELRTLNNGDSVASFSVADNQGKDKPAIFWNCSLFGKRADSLAQYLQRGQAVTVVGTLSEREYEKDGQKRKAQDVRVNDVALQGGSKQQGAASAAKPQGRPAPSPDFEDDQIPF